MVYKCEYDPMRDIAKVVPDLSVDLVAAIETGVVLDTGTIAEHNEIDDPSSVIGRVRDCFDAFEAKKAILNAGRIQQPAGSAAPAVDSPSTSSE